MQNSTVSGKAPMPWDAVPAMTALLRDPNDTSHVFTIIQALSFNTLERLERRFRKTESGRRILAERRQLLPALADRAALEAMPEGSLGRAYLAFLAREGITASGLVAASESGFKGEPLEDEALNLVNDRMRDQHDLWHVLTGYRGDLIGEAALLAFTFAQTWNPGVAFIAAIGRFKSRLLPEASATIREAYRRGRHAEWLPAQDWEALLPLPLEEVRARLRIGAPPRYEPVYAREVDLGTCPWKAADAA
jgi:ubiquinone biosynthesis protein COQ4